MAKPLALHSLFRAASKGDRTVIKHLIRDETAATAVEYGLIIALIALAAVTALAATGNALSDVMSTAEQGMRG